MRPLSRRIVLGLSLCALVGCSKQDNERLGRIGRKLFDRAHTAADEIGGKLDLGWKGEAGLQERVMQRLRWEKALEGANIEVKVNEGAVELRGSVKTVAQRDKALELANATLGVTGVTDG